MTTPVSSQELHTIQNEPTNIPSSVTLSDLQKRHVGLVLDLFQAKGTMAKIEDGFTEDAVYEDMFATCKDRKELGMSRTWLSTRDGLITKIVAGQFLGLPIVTKESITLYAEVVSLTPGASATRGNNVPAKADQIDIRFTHRFIFKFGGKQVDMNSTLIVFSDEKEGKIIRLQDRPMEEIPDNSLISALRKLNAVVAPAMVIPQDEKKDADMVEKFQR
ncbi:hypothetical protein HWV62_3641 [Athelia sp. TMB]|nr:hypothetical protein HWV62_3641 [Athelia sp. TMB]